MLLLIAALMVVAALLPKPGIQRGMRVAAVEANCQRVAKQRLVSPATAEFHPVAHATEYSGAWRYSFTVDSQNAFGATLTTRWGCTVQNDTVTVTPR